ncbi:MAG: MMPL family transporter [Congregibacter sp.]
MSRLNIDTDMTAVLPENGFPPRVKRALDTLNADVQARISFVLSSDEPALSESVATFREGLAAIDGLLVLPSAEALSTSLLPALVPYRFHLLAPSQKEFLASAHPQQLVDAGVRSLYRVTTPRLLDFEKDPFSLHQQTLIDLALQMPQHNAGDTPYEVVSAVLYGKALQASGQSGLEQKLDSALAAARAKARALGQELVVDRSGVFFFAVDAAQRSKADISGISAISSAAIFILLLSVFRRFKATFLPVLSIALGIGCGFIVTHTVFGGVHIFAIIFGVGLIGVVIDYSLHYLYHSPAARHSKERSRLLSALTLSAVTSTIGYGALYFSSLAVLQSVAVFAVSGITLSWLTVVSLGAYFEVAEPRRLLFVEALNRRVAAGMESIPSIAIVLAVTTITMLTATVIGTYRFTDSASVFFTPDPEILRSDQRASAYTNDVEPGRFVVVTGEDVASLYKSQRALLEVAREATGQNPSAIVSLLSWVPEIREQAENYQQQGTLYGESGAVGLLYEQLSIAGAENVRADYASAEGRYLTPEKLLEFLGPSLPTSWWQDAQGVVSLALVRKGEHVDALDELLRGHDEFTYVNMLERTSEALRKQRQSSTRLLCLAFALAGLLLAVFYRELRAFALISVPVLACLVAVSTLILSGRELNLFHIMACFLILGFGMDYVIFARQMESDSDTTMQAISLSWITSQLSFGLLGLSNIGIVSSFGEALFLGNSCNLIGVLVYRAIRARSQTRSGVQQE